MQHRADTMTRLTLSWSRELFGQVVGGGEVQLSSVVSRAIGQRAKGPILPGTAFAVLPIKYHSVIVQSFAAHLRDKKIVSPKSTSFDFACR